MKKASYTFILFIFVYSTASAQLLNKAQKQFSSADTLRGMITPLRSCYDINYYHLDVTIESDRKYISGSNEFRFTATQDFSRLQFDLFSNLKVDSVIYQGLRIPYTRAFHAVFITFPSDIKKGTQDRFKVFYSGAPMIARQPPWDGGFIYAKDRAGNPWISVACQGLGASSWWPNKDHQSDEPDSVSISITPPPGLQSVSNGKLKSIVQKANGCKQYNWFVSKPINNYNVTFYIGKYAHWQDSYAGEKGELSLDFWSLKEDSLRARPHWQADTKSMLKSFEHWFGPYPFYEDGYKLVQSPYLGMEHQSAIAYGNQFQKGYLGKDLSGSGWGLGFDFITIHESGHEWFGNNITAKDIADMWVHEAFTTYSEALFVESKSGKSAATDYIVGLRQNILNDKPMIGNYHVNHEGSGDMYYKGANMIHLIRQLINNDDTFRSILRGMNKVFYHNTVSTQEIENYISTESGLKLDKIFDQYLRHHKVPLLEYTVNNNKLKYRWVADVEDFDMPVRVTLKKGRFDLIYPTTEWKTVEIDQSISSVSFKIDPNFYVSSKVVQLKKRDNNRPPG